MRALPSCLLLLVLTACSPGADQPPDPASSPSPTFDRTEVHSDLAAVFAGDRPGPEAAGKGECFADRLLAAATPEELRDGGVLDDGLTVVDPFPALGRSLAEKVVAAQLACTDFVADSARAGSFVTKGRLVRQRYAACLRRRLPDETVRGALVAAVMGEWEDPAVERLSTAQLGCSRRADP